MDGNQIHLRIYCMRNTLKRLCDSLWVKQHYKCLINTFLGARFSECEIIDCVFDLRIDKVPTILVIYQLIRLSFLLAQVFHIELYLPHSVLLEEVYSLEVLTIVGNVKRVSQLVFDKLIYLFREDL